MDLDNEEPRGSAEYRQRQAEMLALAEAATLEGQRAKYLRAAERWRQLAELAEHPPQLHRRTA